MIKEKVSYLIDEYDSLKKKVNSFNDKVEELNERISILLDENANVSNENKELKELIDDNSNTIWIYQNFESNLASGDIDKKSMNEDFEILFEKIEIE